MDTPHKKDIFSHLQCAAVYNGELLRWYSCRILRCHWVSNQTVFDDFFGGKPSLQLTYPDSQSFFQGTQFWVEKSAFSPRLDILSKPGE